MDRRSEEHRHRVLKTGLITPEGHRTSMHCLVRDISTQGARLRVESAIGIPEAFDLFIAAENFMRPASVKWRHGKQLGVEFFERRVDRPRSNAGKFKERRGGGPLSSAPASVRLN